MKEVFNKLDQYESRFSSDVWTNVNKVLVEKRRKRKQRNLFFCFSIFLLLSTSYYLYQLSLEDVPSVALLEGEALVSHQNDLMPSLLSNDTNEPEGKTADIQIDKLDDEVYDNKSQLYIEKEYQNRNIIHSSMSANYDQDVGMTIVSLGSNTLVADLLDDELEVKYSKSENLVSPLDGIHSQVDMRSIENLRFNLNNLFLKGTCPTFGDANYRIYTWSQFTGLLPIAQFKLKNSNDELYKTARETTEKGLISAEGAIGLGLVLRKGYYVEAGLQYAQWREKFSYIDPESISYQTVITIDTIFQAMDTLITSDTTRTEVPGSREIVHHNSHKNFNIPVILGFQKNINEALSFSVKAGVVFNIQLKSEGRILDNNMITKSVNANDSGYLNVYKPKLSTQFLIGGQLNYNLSTEIQAYVSPSIRFTQSDITNSSYALKQTYINPSLSVGLKYFL